MIIESLLDSDLYKFTMQQAVWSRFPQAHVRYAFQCRSKNVDLSPYAAEIRAEIDHLCELRLTEAELAYLHGIRFIQPGYVDSLRQLRLDPAAVTIATEPQFAITIEGNWYQTILFEVPILAIVNEVYFRNTQTDDAANRRVGLERLQAKCDQINAAPVPLSIIEFGTRRRYAQDWQQTVLETMRERVGPALIGTSNLGFAHTLGMKPFGTMAHEFLQAGQAFAPVADSQKFALETWMQVYRGDLGIALSDVAGMDAFFRDFDLLFCKAYDGARHDSGDPYLWGERLIAHYKKRGIDPTTKTAVFSDGLSVEKAIALAKHFQGRIRLQFGIGTSLTNDLGFEPLQIVLKMIRCIGRPVVKVSDSPGKAMYDDPTYLAYVKEAFGIVSATAPLPPTSGGF
jgi:nicotinate phosphoribosyltransferase